jgi:alpha-L-rhamnosidase
MRRLFLSISAVLIFASPHGSAQTSFPLLITNLRCEYLTNPLGIGAIQPRLSWVLESGDSSARGQRQTSYRIIVSSSLEKLKSDDGDVWDTRRVPSDQTIQMSYAGKPLRSKLAYYWKVRIWDENDRPSNWSAPASWTMGLLEKSEWAAKWISDPTIATTSESDEESIRGVRSGYRSQVASSPSTEKWVQVDLKQPRLIDSVQLDPAYPYEWQPGGPAYNFPLRFKIESAERLDFTDAFLLVDETQHDVLPPLMNVPGALFRFTPTSARYVRVVVTRLYPENELFSAFALAQMKVFSHGENVAAGKPVTALDSLEGPGWSKAYVVDGVAGTIHSREYLQPAGMFRKSFPLKGGIRRATLYATARGLYELHINGNRVGNHILAPEWTDYSKRIQYQTYDVTSLVRSGENAIGAYLAAGWYAGHVGLMPSRRIYGPVPQLLLHLDVEYVDGQMQSIVTDESWKRSGESPIVSSDVYDGETYDARKEQPGWDKPNFDDDNWLPVNATIDGTEELVWQRNEPVIVTGDLKPVAVTQPSPGVYIFDFGQNHSGWTRLRIRGLSGTIITIRHGEALNPVGSLYVPNVRNAWQIDHYVLRGSGEETFEPHFTIHGYRYAEVSGLRDPPGPDTVVARVVRSSSPEVSQFSTSSTYLDKLMSNILWTQRSNMIGIPTDCPQRDERLGWTGDALTFSQTAIFNMDMAAFYTKWMQDMRDDQSADGRFPDVAPNPMNVSQSINPAFQGNLLDGSPAWADAGVLIPWRTYENYGDSQLLNVQFEAAKHWVEFIHEQNPALLWKNARGLDPGDWLNGDTLILTGWPPTGGAIPHTVFATAYFAHTTEILSKMAVAIGRSEDARRYAELFTQIKRAFNQAFVDSDGHIEGDTQAGYALALDFDLLPQGLRAAAFAHLLEGLRRYDGHLSTGIHASRSVMLQLTSNGRDDEAYRLLNLHTVPSWGHMVDMGATTMWERWDGYVANRGFENHTAMNSLNHVVLGAVGEWMWRNIVGLAPDDSNPGYKHFTIYPRLGGGLISAKGTYQSVRGRITSEWIVADGFFSLNLEVPPNTSATVYLPASDASKIQESGRDVQESKDVRFFRIENGSAVFEVLSGSYHFRSPLRCREEDNGHGCSDDRNTGFSD